MFILDWWNDGELLRWVTWLGRSSVVDKTGLLHMKTCRQKTEPSGHDHGPPSQGHCEGRAATQMSLHFPIAHHLELVSSQVTLRVFSYRKQHHFIMQRCFLFGGQLHQRGLCLIFISGPILYLCLQLSHPFIRLPMINYLRKFNWFPKALWLGRFLQP